MGLNGVRNWEAVRDFREARRRAALEQALARLTGATTDLLSYEEVRRKLRANTLRPRGLQDVPLDAIVGSVGRYTDFSRTFLPLHDADQSRWANIKVTAEGPQGLPPVELYKIGEAYFVKDGHHRISVARSMKSETIQAYVTEVQTPVPLSPDDSPDDLILKAEYARFLDHTHLNETRPHADLRVTSPGQYDVLEEHIRTHRYFMGLEQQREIPYPEAAAHWYDVVYRPVEEVIYERGLLRDFPDRTAADLYLWLMEHRAELVKELGWEVPLPKVAADLAEQHGERAGQIVARWSEKLLASIVPDALQGGPSTGTWRSEVLSRRDKVLFADILVPIPWPQSDGWPAVTQALEIARREQATLHGLWVHPPDEENTADTARLIEAQFLQRCASANVPADFSTVAGEEVAPRICEYARWADLVVVHLRYPPAMQFWARLSSGFRTLVRRCAPPVMAVPQAIPTMRRVLLAYDDSPKAQEALFVATYLATAWESALVVLTVKEPPEGEKIQARARQHLEKRKVQAEFIQRAGDAATAILTAAQEHECDLLIMGGYERAPALEAVLGSTVDRILQESAIPVLTCR